MTKRRDQTIKQALEVAREQCQGDADAYLSKPNQPGSWEFFIPLERDLPNNEQEPCPSRTDRIRRRHPTRAL